MKKLLLTLSALLVSAFGGSYEDGLNAYNTGDYDQAIVCWQKAADQGHVKAKYNLGVMYERGRGVKQDHEKAVELWQNAADEGHVRAQYNLGVMYEIGIGVKQDHEKAVEFWQKAADQGLDRAKLILKLYS